MVAALKILSFQEAYIPNRMKSLTLCLSQMKLKMKKNKKFELRKPKHEVIFFVEKSLFKPLTALHYLVVFFSTTIVFST